FLFLSHPATSHISTLSLHDALPISESIDPLVRQRVGDRVLHGAGEIGPEPLLLGAAGQRVRLSVVENGGRVEAHRDAVGDVESGDRKSTRLNSSHVSISYAVFCLKK